MQSFTLVTRQTIQFNQSSDFAVDVVGFLDHLTVGRLSEAVDLYRGDLLAGIDSESDVFDVWLLAKCGELHQELRQLEKWARRLSKFSLR